MNSKRLSWQRALLAGFAALLLAPAAWSGDVAQTGDVALRMSDAPGIVNHPLPPPRTEPCAFYNNRSHFMEIHNPTGAELSMETWKYGSVNPGGVYACSGYLDYFGDGLCFQYEGEIVAGITVRETPARGSQGLALCGVGFGGVPSKTVVANFFIDAISYDFSDPRGKDNGANVTAWGVDMQHVLGPTESEVEVTVFLASGAEYTVNLAAAPKGIFGGICCDELINRIEVNSTGNLAEGADNIMFGDFGLCGEGDLPPVTIEDIHTGLDILELKLDEWE